MLKRTCQTADIRWMSPAHSIRTHPRALLLVLLGVLVTGLLPSTALAAPTASEFGAGNAPLDVTAGPDGNVWFVEYSANKIARVTPSGTVTEFSSGLSGGAGLEGISAGPDGNLWFTEGLTNKIGRITPSGTITQFSAGISGGSGPNGIVAGPDGNLWFTETTGNRIGRITPAGVVTEYSVGISPSKSPWDITAGRDGNLWFTEHVVGGGVARITTSGVVTEFASSGQPSGITAGPDGNIWFAEYANPGFIARVTPTGTVTEYSTGLTANVGPQDIEAGADGNLYFTESKLGGTLGQITTSGIITQLAPALTGAPYDITAGADGNMWFTENADDKVGRLTVAPAAVTLAPLAISDTDATLAGKVRPNSQATTYHFEWGSTTSYGSSTPLTPAGSGASALPVTATISALASAGTYHYRLVATNASGTTNGADAVFTTQAAPIVVPDPPVVPPPAAGPGGPTLPPVSRPVFGQTATIAAISGSVLVELQGTSTFIPLSAASTVPVGTTIDATAGTVRLTNLKDRGGKLQSATFWGGAFTVGQSQRKHAPTVLALAAPVACSTAARLVAAAGATPKGERHLWGRDNHGRFVTRGRSAVATVRGTAWFMRESCAGTFVRVSQGSVSVRDLVRHRTIIVGSGHSYLARRG
jgi:streptogramin lyase